MKKKYSTPFVILVGSALETIQGITSCGSDDPHLGSSDLPSNLEEN